MYEHGFTTVAMSDKFNKTGRIFYEARIDSAVGCAQLGWAGDKFAPSSGDITDDKGVGDDEDSWGADGLRRVAFHDREQSPFDVSWTDGDVIGVAADLNSGRILYALNGDWITVFDGINVPTSGLAPALAATGGFSATLNFGGDSFAFGKPDKTFASVKQADSHCHMSPSRKTAFGAKLEAVSHHPKGPFR